MAASQADAALGRLMVQQQIIDQAQLDSLLGLQVAMPDMSLGELMVDSGILSREQLNVLVATAQQMTSAPAPRPAPAPPVRPVQQPGMNISAPSLQPLGVQPAARPPPATGSPRPQPVQPAARPAPTTNATRLPPVPSNAPQAPRAAAHVEKQPAPAHKGMTVLPRLELPPEPEGPLIMDLELEPVVMDLPLEPVGQRLFSHLTSAADPREEMELILRIAADMSVSDLHLHSGQRISTRSNGELVEQETRPLPADRIALLVGSILDENQRNVLEDAGELDFAYTLPGVARFRANAYRHHRGMDATFRVIPLAPPTLVQLGLPLTLSELISFHNGLVLFTGPSGCGKSTTMAAMVSMLNQSRDDHILTVEDPIEFLHRPARCSVNQRQVGAHTSSFARALRGALREDPDVIVVGELRDLETISLALSAAETGHLVLGTLHTNNAIRTVNRLIGAFPPEQQEQIRAMLSESLRGVVSQRLLRTTDGKRRVPALEIMMVNKAVSNLIKENKTTQIRSILQTSSGEGMCLLDNSLAELVKTGAIKREEAARYAEEPKRFGA